MEDTDIYDIEDDSEFTLNDIMFFDKTADYDLKIKLLDEIATTHNLDYNLPPERYEKGLIGFMLKDDDLRAVYCDEYIIQDLMVANEWDYEQSVEWYDCNTYRAWPYNYSQTAKCPIIVNYRYE